MDITKKTSMRKNVLLNSYYSIKIIQRNLNDFWCKKLNLKVRFWHFLTPPCYTNLQTSMFSIDNSWFLAKNLSNFVSLAWKLHNRYCHKGHNPQRVETECYFFIFFSVGRYSIEKWKKKSSTYSYHCSRFKTSFPRWKKISRSLFYKPNLPFYVGHIFKQSLNLSLSSWPIWKKKICFGNIL